MGIFRDQYVGLNEWALRLINGEPVFVYTEETTRIYPDGRRKTLEPYQVYESSVKKEKSGNFYIGESSQDHRPLYKYTFPNGKKYFEAVQAVTRSSGQIYFLALQDEEKNWVPESLWGDEDIHTA